jgi:peptidyl-Lys metalloendopeptidase
MDIYRFGEVFLCGAFWKAPLNGSDSQGGTLVHEASHFTQNGGTADIAYGEDDCKELAMQEPGSAIRNADSYEYYTENNPPLA